MKIKNHLREVLKERNITQIELSQETNLRPATINSIVRNNTSSMNYEHTVKIATALGIHNLNHLYSLEDSPNDYNIGSNENYRKVTNDKVDNLINEFNLEFKYAKYYESLIILWEEKIKQCSSKSSKKTLQKEIEKMRINFQKCNNNVEFLHGKILIAFSLITDKERLHQYYNKLDCSPLKMSLKEEIKNF